MIRKWTRDPRHFQIAVLSLLLTYGVMELRFPITLPRLLVTLGTAIAIQWLGHRWMHRKAKSVPCGTRGPAARGIAGVPGVSGLAGVSRRPLDLRSPIISSLSLCLLLRTDDLWIAAAAAAIAIGSKFLFRVGKKHVFNPANIGIAAVTLATSHAWVSPGQWGSVALLGFTLAGLGGLVVYRAARSDVAYAFIATYALVLFGRALWLGDPLTIPVHQLSSGALLLFTFFMISDPKTTPDSRTGRFAHGILVALVACAFRFVFFQPDGLLWSLALAAPLVPVWDRLFPGTAYEWSAPRIHTTPNLSHDKGANPMQSRRRFGRRFAGATMAVLGLSFLTQTASAFCGFYVAKADADLFNQASQVVLVRDGDRTVITMASDYQGEPSEFALVVPVPTVLEREQIHVTEQSLLDHLDAYTSPRLVEYFDSNPCHRYEVCLDAAAPSARQSAWGAMKSIEEEAKELGVTIEATYTVGEYDILILSAKESDGLQTWLDGNGYRTPKQADRVLSSYIRQGMKFFVAKVNLDEKAKQGVNNLRPIQVAFESPKFMLPLRLGTVNANGPQEMFVYALTRTGRVESTNYRTVRLPSDMDIPTYIKDDFGDFYTAMFDHQWKSEGRNVVFLEYAWDMNWCDPCAADPLSVEQLRELGVFWADANHRGGGKSMARDVFVTRMHVRYDGRHFPEDLVFRETGDRSNFQGRYVLRHPFMEPIECNEAESYYSQVAERQEREATNLASLTGWDISDIRRDMEIPNFPKDSSSWWKTLWKD